MRIVSQEKNPAGSTVYSPPQQQAETFRIFYIDRIFIIPADFRQNAGLSQLPDAHLNLPSPVSTPIRDQESYVRQYHEDIWHELLGKCEEFIATFIIVAGYLDQAAQRLNVIVDGLISMNRFPDITGPLKLILGNLVMARVSSYVLEKLWQISNRHDEKMCTILESYHTVAQSSPTKFGLSSLLADQLDMEYFKNTCGMLASLLAAGHQLMDEPKTPLLLKIQISTAVNDMSTSCQAMLKQRMPHRQIDLSADDLLPLLVLCIIYARPNRIYAHMQYLKHFHTNALSNEYPQLGYCYSTLVAAVEYIQSDPLQLTSALVESVMTPTPRSSSAKSHKRNGSTITTPTITSVTTSPSVIQTPDVPQTKDTPPNAEEDFLDTLRRMDDGASSSNFRTKRPSYF